MNGVSQYKFKWYLRTYPKFTLLSILKSVCSILVREACFSTEFKEVKVINGDQKHMKKKTVEVLKSPNILAWLLKTDIILINI